MHEDEHATVLKHGIKIHGRNPFMKLNKNHPLTGSNKHGKNAFGKQISDLVKLTLVWNFRSDSTLWSIKTICYRI